MWSTMKRACLLNTDSLLTASHRVRQLASSHNIGNWKQTFTAMSRNIQYVDGSIHYISLQS